MVREFSLAVSQGRPPGKIAPETGDGAIAIDTSTEFGLPPGKEIATSHWLRGDFSAPRSGPRAKWSENKAKLKTCRAEVRSKGLAGDDRWFYIEDCMEKT